MQNCCSSFKWLLSKSQRFTSMPMPGCPDKKITPKSPSSEDVIFLIICRTWTMQEESWIAVPALHASADASGYQVNPFGGRWPSCTSPLELSFQSHHSINSAFNLGYPG